MGRILGSTCLVRVLHKVSIILSVSVLLYKGCAAPRQNVIRHLMFVSCMCRMNMVMSTKSYEGSH